MKENLLKWQKKSLKLISTTGRIESAFCGGKLKTTTTYVCVRVCVYAHQGGRIKLNIK